MVLEYPATALQHRVQGGSRVYCTCVTELELVSCCGAVGEDYPRLQLTDVAARGTYANASLASDGAGAV